MTTSVNQAADHCVKIMLRRCEPATWQTKQALRMTVGMSASTETACSTLLLAGTQLTTAESAAISVTFRLLGPSDETAHNQPINHSTIRYDTIRQMICTGKLTGKLPVLS